MENHYRELLRFLVPGWGSTCSGDVAHDAYLRVLERSSQAQIEHPKAFLYRTALNLAVDEHRRSRVRRAEPLEVLDDEEGLASPSPQTVVDQGQRLDNLQRALAELPAICRSSFLLRKLDGLSIRRSPNISIFPQPGGKAHRQRDEALSGAHARMGSRLISLFVLGNA